MLQYKIKNKTAGIDLPTLKGIAKFLINGMLKLATKLIPKSKRMVVCGGWEGKRFADNSKAMFLFLECNKCSLGLYKVIFITRQKAIKKELRTKGYEWYLQSSPIGWWYQLRAFYHIIDCSESDLNRSLSVGAVRINLWHGFPIKKIGYYTKNISTVAEAVKQNNDIAHIQLGNWQKCYLLAGSDDFEKHLMLAFGREKNMILRGVAPRLVYMFSDKKVYMENEQRYIKKIRRLKERGKKIILYLPTFREDRHVENELIRHIADLSKSLLDNLVIAVKMHSAAKVDLHLLESLKNVLLISGEADVYNFLSEADALITDYSSVYLDYLFLNRPIIFFSFDLEYYMKDDRGFLYQYEDVVSGDICRNTEELMKTLREVFHDTKAYQSQYTDKIAAIKKMISYTDIFDEKCLYELWEQIKHCPYLK